VDRFADVLAFQSLRIAVDVDADQPSAGSPADNLTSLSSHAFSKNNKCGTRVAHVAAA